RTQIRAAFIFGGALFLLGHGGLAWAQQTVPSGVAALLIGSIPLWMALLDRIFFGKRLHPSATLGLVVGFVGLAFLFDPFGEGSFDRLGALVCVLAALAWAAGSLYSRGAPLPKRPLVSAGLAALCGGVLLLVAGAVGGELGDLHPTADALGAIAYLIVVGTLVGFVAYVWLLRNAPTSLVSTYAYVNPLIAVALGFLFLGEEITGQMLAAGAVILVSVALIVRKSGEALEPGRGLRRRRAPVLGSDLQGKQHPPQRKGSRWVAKLTGAKARHTSRKASSPTTRCVRSRARPSRSRARPRTRRKTSRRKRATGCRAGDLCGMPAKAPERAPSRFGRVTCRDPVHARGPLQAVDDSDHPVVR